MSKTIKLKRVSNGVISYIPTWTNFVHNYQGTRNGSMKQPASEAIHDFGGKFKIDENNKNYLDSYIEFDTEEQLTYWLLRFA